MTAEVFMDASAWCSRASWSSRRPRKTTSRATSHASRTWPRIWLSPTTTVVRPILESLTGMLGAPSREQKMSSWHHRRTRLGLRRLAAEEVAPSVGITAHTLRLAKVVLLAGPGTGMQQVSVSLRYHHVGGYDPSPHGRGARCVARARSARGDFHAGGCSQGSPGLRCSGPAPGPRRCGGAPGDRGPRRRP